MMTDPTELVQSVYAAVCRSIGTYPSRPFLHIPAVCCQSYHNGPIDLTYAELGQRLEMARETYALAGYQAGQRVALLLENRPDFFVHWFALNALGVSVVPINGEMAASETTVANIGDCNLTAQTIMFSSIEIHCENKDLERRFKLLPDLSKYNENQALLRKINEEVELLKNKSFKSKTDDEAAVNKLQREFKKQNEAFGPTRRSRTVRWS